MNCTPKVGHKTFGVLFMKYGYEAKCQNRIPSGVVNLHDLADGLEAGGETLYQL